MRSTYRSFIWIPQLVLDVVVARSSGFVPLDRSPEKILWVVTTFRASKKWLEEVCGVVPVWLILPTGIWPRRILTDRADCSQRAAFVTWNSKYISNIARAPSVVALTSSLISKFSLSKNDFYFPYRYGFQFLTYQECFFKSHLFSIRLFIIPSWLHDATPLKSFNAILGYGVAETLPTICSLMSSDKSSILRWIVSVECGIVEKFCAAFSPEVGDTESLVLNFNVRFLYAKATRVRHNNYTVLHLQYRHAKNARSFHLKISNSCSFELAKVHRWISRFSNSDSSLREWKLSNVCVLSSCSADVDLI